jgi:tRNA dimethylallyltransferase
MTNPATHAPVLVLLGPTASGKSDLALKLAHQFNGEIVTIDSAQVYQDMNIGTAKPDSTTRAQVPHHLLDLIAPTASYSAARFCDDAIACVRDIRARGKRPILAGGTMLYYKALRDGLDDVPPADLAARTRIDADAHVLGWPALHARLAQVDPATAARLHATDAQRISRALEVYEATGKPLSMHFSSTMQANNRMNRPFAMHAISLEPSDRSVLHTRISQRFDAMLAAQFVDEVRDLRTRYVLHAQLPAMRCVGYRQVWDYLEGLDDYDAMREKGVIATRQLAKRQLTWLRSMPEVTRFDCLHHNLHNAVLEHVEKWIGESA